MITVKYLTTFIFYILAMTGIILIAFLAFKNFALTGVRKKNSSINVEESLSLSPRKTLYIINIRGERFLIAGDADKTTFLAKLDNNEKLDEINIDINNTEDDSDEIDINIEKPMYRKEKNVISAKESSMRKLLKKLSNNKNADLGE